MDKHKTLETPTVVRHILTSSAVCLGAVQSAANPKACLLNAAAPCCRLIVIQHVLDTGQMPGGCSAHFVPNIHRSVG